ncbi:tRNA binding protein [Fragilaria crotonensis]|nr:tRNA binding protein [Fragilaria crotonensis]
MWAQRHSMNRMLALRVIVIHICSCHSFTPRSSSSLQRSWLLTRRESSTDAVEAASRISTQFQVPDDKRLLIHWKGEINDKYSFHFRHYEFAGALDAVSCGTSPKVKYENALSYDGEVVMADHERVYFDESMQYVQGIDNLHHAVEASKRCSLVHAIYHVVAIQDSYVACNDAALVNGGFSDMYVGAANQSDKWCLRVRHYGGDVPTDTKGKRFGERARSMQEERKALQDMTPLVSKLGGGVNLKKPDCHIYVFNGLKGKTVLARRIASGPQVYRIAPTTRICITNTPLCPIAAFSLCNVAGVTDQHSVLDPYAGSCTTLLAASMIAPGVKMVGIEIAHEGIVNRNDVMRDFETRNLTAPLALIYGDSTDESIRDHARSLIHGDAFDLIITDPPYGIRESTNYNDQQPLSELCCSIARDREMGKPLLKKGGKLVAFVPCTDEETIDECLPNASTLEKAGLALLDMIEQPLNEKLSRWLVSFECKR